MIDQPARERSPGARSPWHPALAAIATVALLAVCSCAMNAVLFRAQVTAAALEHARARLRESGADRSKILRPSASSQLLVLEPGKPYKMVVLGDGKLAVAPQPASTPNNPWSHVALADGAPVRSAGNLVVEHGASEVTRITLDQDSHA
jgi:hypothetical protein